MPNPKSQSIGLRHNNNTNTPKINPTCGAVQNKS